jgi:hypothetical protein
MVEILDRELEEATRIYRYEDGRPTLVIYHIRVVCRTLREHYGFTLAEE